MAELRHNAELERRATGRSCGSCSLCCTALRVDELSKLAGRDCVHQRGEHGCGIYERRPAICRSYRCLWLQGGLEDDERPDAIGAVVDLETRGMSVGLSIIESSPGCFDASPKLQAIAERYRSSMPVRVSDTARVLDPDHPFRVLLPENIEHRVRGDLIAVYLGDELIAERRQPWAERLARRARLWWRRSRLA